jgi:Leucine-rich repeat (LRR) protein
MKNLKSLREVSIGGIGHVPDFISGLKDLESLDISHNKLVTLPGFIGNLQS